MKIIIPLVALTACTSNLLALTKTRALAQAATVVAHTAVNYARQHKLKTAGIVIGGAIALDVLQVGARWKLHNKRKTQVDKVKIEAELRAKAAASDKAKEDLDKLEKHVMAEQRKNCEETYKKAKKLFEDARKEYMDIFFFYPREKSFLFQIYDKLTKRK